MLTLNGSNIQKNKKCRDGLFLNPGNLKSLPPYSSVLSLSKAYAKQLRRPNVLGALSDDSQRIRFCVVSSPSGAEGVSVMKRDRI